LAPPRCLGWLEFHADSRRLAEPGRAMARVAGAATDPAGLSRRQQHRRDRPVRPAPASARPLDLW